MKRVTIFACLIIFGLAFIGSVVTTVEAAYIRGVHVYLKASPQYQARKLLKLEKGDEVTILEEKGYWRKVKARGIEGWLTRMSLVEKKQVQKFSAFKLKKTPLKKRNVRIRVARAAVGVKGLRESQIKQIEDSYDMKALETMENFAVNEEEATRFVMDYSE